MSTAQLEELNNRLTTAWSELLEAIINPVYEDEQPSN